MKLKEIQELIDFISNSGLNEVDIETENFKISVKRDAKVKQIVEKGSAPAAASVSAPAPAPSPEPAPGPAPAAETLPSNLVEIKSPMIGTFYRSPNPESPEFIQVGDSVSKGQTVCIIEAMKLFNEIEAEVSGTIVKVLVENSSPVEYDQPLFLVEPE